MRSKVHALLWLLPLCNWGCEASPPARPNAQDATRLATIQASTDPEVVARGRYLVNGPAHCANCHVAPAARDAYERGDEVPLSGGQLIAMPIGDMYVPNITPDAATGLGNVSDLHLARALRFSIGADGHALFPFMPFQNMSGEDLTAVISYLRALPPLVNKVPPHEFNLFGTVVRNWLMDPWGPEGEPPARITADESAAYGEYLAKSVADCRGCHTKRDMKTGVFTGSEYAGGLELEAINDPTKLVVSPNLTPDPTTGRMANWSEAQFIERFRRGPAVPGSHMPWGAFLRLTDGDLRAIYRFLTSLAPVVNDTGPSLKNKD